MSAIYKFNIDLSSFAIRVVVGAIHHVCQFTLIILHSARGLRFGQRRECSIEHYDQSESLTLNIQNGLKDRHQIFRPV